MRILTTNPVFEFNGTSVEAQTEIDFDHALRPTRGGMGREVGTVDLLPHPADCIPRPASSGLEIARKTCQNTDTVRPVGYVIPALVARLNRLTHNQAHWRLARLDAPLAERWGALTPVSTVHPLPRHDRG